MKKILLIIGVVSIIVCVLFLLFSLLNMHAYYHLVDGTARHYNRLHLRMIVSFVIATVFAVIGTVSMILHFKL